jgi:hypothetical protein
MGDFHVGGEAIEFDLSIDLTPSPSPARRGEPEIYNRSQIAIVGNSF